ncbi:histone-fold-containing protein [Absidia repens]|uniref:Histone-fold-containing protein n=1 Tax=Absidia repens TaxID=90262 RepID=A0A1X2HY07_9FUNG|nr:histone-fold-containing protein [Absidia repens]
MNPNNQEASAVNVNTITTRKRSSKVARRVSFDRYLRIIQRQIHPACKISADSLRALNSMVGSLFKRIASEAGELAKKEKRPTLMPRDVEFACRLVLPMELQIQARAAGDKAVEKYQDTLQHERVQREHAQRQ